MLSLVACLQVQSHGQVHSEEIIVIFSSLEKIMITFVLFKPRLPRMRSSRRGGAKLLLPLRCKLQGIAPVCCKPVEGLKESMHHLLLVFASLLGEHT